jgi:hypothetical protein
MATFIKVEDEYLNADAVVSYSRLDRPWNDVRLGLTDGSGRTISNPSSYSSDIPDALEGLLAAVGAPQQDRTRIITFIDGRIDIRYLD